MEAGQKQGRGVDETWASRTLLSDLHPHPHTRMIHPLRRHWYKSAFLPLCFSPTRPRSIGRLLRNCIARQRDTAGQRLAERGCIEEGRTATQPRHNLDAAAARSRPPLPVRDPHDVIPEMRSPLPISGERWLQCNDGSLHLYTSDLSTTLPPDLGTYTFTYI